MDLLSHGGHCCGRRHIYGMNNATTESILRLMRNRGVGPGDVANKIVEIVVSEENETDEQSLDQLREEIVGAGFVLVATWDNDSGSMCYMYLYANDWTAFPGGVAVPLVAPAPPAPEAPRVVFRQWFNVLRAGRSTAGHESFAAARAAAPGAASVDRRDVYASGVTRWVTGVRE